MPPNCPNCSRKMHRNGKTATGIQRWRCRTCGVSHAESTAKPGAKPIGDRPMTVAERKRRQRQRDAARKTHDN